MSTLGTVSVPGAKGTPGASGVTTVVTLFGARGVTVTLPPGFAGCFGLSVKTLGLASVPVPSVPVPSVPVPSPGIVPGKGPVPVPPPSLRPLSLAPDPSPLTPAPDPSLSLLAPPLVPKQFLR